MASKFPTTEYETEMFADIPPFPDDVLTAPLLRLSLSKLKSQKSESERLFSAAQNLGFFYLDLRDDEDGKVLLEESDQLFQVGKNMFGLGREEMEKYTMPKDSYFGYKGFGKGVIDVTGKLDRNEFYNAAKDDFLGISDSPSQHPLVLKDKAALLQSYMRNSHSLINVIFSHLNTHLDLPPETLAALHSQSSVSGDHVRFIKSPPQPISNLGTSMGAHTDYGSLTVLFNRVGGLQVLPPNSTEWAYVRPLPGHCIVNLGDAMVKFTNGLFRSSIHRVVAPPGEQVTETRYSLVYFARPADNVVLKRLEGSSVIPELEDGVIEEDVSSRQWILEKSTTRRTDGYKGPESFRRERETAKMAAVA